MQEAIRQGKRAAIAPVSAFAKYHDRLIKLREQGKLNEKELHTLAKGTHSMLDFAKRLDKERRMQDID